MLDFRNALAHGKSKTKCVEDEVPIGTLPFSEARLEPMKTKWVKYCSQKNAERVIEDITQIVINLFNAANIPGEIPFDMGTEEQIIQQTVTMGVYRTSNGETILGTPQGRKMNEA